MNGQNDELCRILAKCDLFAQGQKGRKADLLSAAALIDQLAEAQHHVKKTKFSTKRVTPTSSYGVLRQLCENEYAILHTAFTEFRNDVSTEVTAPLRAFYTEYEQKGEELCAKFERVFKTFAGKKVVKNLLKAHRRSLRRNTGVQEFAEAHDAAHSELATVSGVMRPIADQMTGLDARYDEKIRQAFVGFNVRSRRMVSKFLSSTEAAEHCIRDTCVENPAPEEQQTLKRVGHIVETLRHGDSMMQHTAIQPRPLLALPGMPRTRSAPQSPREVAEVQRVSQPIELRPIRAES